MSQLSDIRFEEGEIREPNNVDTVTNSLEKLYLELEIIFKNRKIEADVILSIVVTLMQIVDRYPDLKGIEKKLVVIGVLIRYVEENVEDEKTRGDLVMFINLVLPNVIDTFIAIDKRELKIKTEKCLRKYLCCL